MRNDGSFTGKVVVITGASLGIGAELARQLAAERPRLVLAARDAGRLEEVAASCRDRGAEAVIVPTDVSVEGECRALVDRALDAFGAIDCVVLNAGIGMWATVEELRDLSVYERIMRVNYLGSVWCASHALPALRRTQGRLVVVSSLTGKTGVPTRSGYAASKHALHGFFDSLRIELRGTGVSVTLVCPGIVSTGIRARNLDASGRPAGHSHVDEAAAMPVERCVAIMLRAIRGRKREVVYTARARFGQWLKLLAPGMVDDIAARVIARGR